MVEKHNWSKIKFKKIIFEYSLILIFRELDQMIQKERAHVEKIGMDLPPLLYSSLMEELRNINCDKGLNYSCRK